MKTELKTALLASAMTVFGFGLANANDLVLPSEVAATHWKTGYMENFASEVNEKTSGAIDVKLFPAGQLYSDQDALAALGTGSVQMVWPVAVRLETIAPETGVINLPFALSDTMMMNACFKTGVTEHLSATLKPRGLRVLGMLRAADLFFIFRDQDVTKMEDLANSKIRITGGRVLLDTMHALKVNPISMSASEMSTALSQGAIDGVFTSPAGWSEMVGISGKYAWHVPGFSLLTYAVVVDDVWYNELPETEREAISTTIAEISDRQWEEARLADEESIKKMTDQGAIYRVASNEERARWIALAEANAEGFASKHGEAITAVKALEAKCGL